MASNATELFMEMRSEILHEVWYRESADAASPMRSKTREAKPCRTFQLYYPQHNLVVARPVDRVWAVANVLHFFTGSEDAQHLPKYNKNAARFLKDTVWKGAYGAIALPQLLRCVDQLVQSPMSRRAIVSMGGLEHDDINRPACWSFLQFLNARDGLNLLVYQRSLHLFRVMPYDCILLANILYFVAAATSFPMGSLYWTVGSLHTGDEEVAMTGEGRMESIIVPFETLCSPAECSKLLAEGDPAKWTS